MLVLSATPADHRHTNALKAALADIEAPGWCVAFGDTRQMLALAVEQHYRGIKLIHVGGGDTIHGTDGHPDHRTRDAISMLARVHCVANIYARDNLSRLGIWPEAIHVTGSPGLDEVVRYAKTLDTERERSGAFEWYPEDTEGRGNWAPMPGKRLDPQEFLHRLAHAELFRSNSSAALYEAPILGTPVELVGDRQAGRRGPYHAPDGDACQHIRKVVENACL